MIVDQTKSPKSSTTNRVGRNPSHVTFSSNVTGSGGGIITSSVVVAPGNSVGGSHSVSSGRNDENVGGGVKNIGWLVKSRARSAEIPNKSANEYIWKKIEGIIEKMQDETFGVPIRTVKSLMSTVPSVFTGSDLVQWFIQHLNADNGPEAAHLGSMIASMGFLFPITDHLLAVRNDAHTFYRFQTPCLYPGRCPEVDNIEYAVYLCKRTMQNKQRLELADFEAERLATLQSFYWHKWEFIYLQAEAEAKVDKKRDKVERLVLESQEKGFWDATRPVAGAVNNNDIDMRKLCRAKRPKKTVGRPSWFPIPSGSNGVLLWSSLESSSANEKLARLRACLERKRVRSSKSVENIQNYYEQYIEYDLLVAAVGDNSAIMSTSILGGENNGAGAVASSSQLTQFGQGSSEVQSGNINVTSGSGGGGGGGGAISGGGTVAAGATTTTASVSAAAAAASTGLTASGNTTNGLAASSALVSGGNVGGGGGGAVCGGGGNNNNNITGSGVNNADNTSYSSASNPWVSDSIEFWNQEISLKDISARRVRRWGFSIHELLKDPAGREEIQKWLEKEFSAENLTFLEMCQELKGAPLRELGTRIETIYSQYLAPNAAEPLNVDSRVADNVRQRVTRSSGSNPDRYCFDEAEEHIFKLMTSDSYYRFLRSNIYKELMAGQKKKSKRKFPADIRQRLEIE